MIVKQINLTLVYFPLYELSSCQQGCSDREWWKYWKQICVGPAYVISTIKPWDSLERKEGVNQHFIHDWPALKVEIMFKHNYAGFCGWMLAFGEEFRDSCILLSLTFWHSWQNFLLMQELVLKPCVIVNLRIPWCSKGGTHFIPCFSIGITSVLLVFPEVHIFLNGLC